MTWSGNTNPVPPGNAELYALLNESPCQANAPALLFLPLGSPGGHRAPERRGLVKGRTELAPNQRHGLFELARDVAAEPV